MRGRRSARKRQISPEVRLDVSRSGRFGARIGVGSEKEPLHAVSLLFRPFLLLSELASKSAKTSGTCWVFGRSAAESIAWFYTLFRCFDTPPPQQHKHAQPLTQKGVGSLDRGSQMSRHVPWPRPTASNGVAEEGTSFCVTVAENKAKPRCANAPGR